MTQQHTMTPWKLSDNYPVEIKGPKGLLAVCAQYEHEKGLCPEGQANAAFIVGACNSHDDLITTLERTLDALEKATRWDNNVVLEGRITLSKAKAQS